MTNKIEKNNKAAVNSSNDDAAKSSNNSNWGNRLNGNSSSLSASGYNLDNINMGPIVPYNEPWIRGERHSTLMAFWMCLWTSLVSGFVFFAGFFYWPLIRKWVLYSAEFRWGWTLTFTKWYCVILSAFAAVMLCISIVGIPFAILLFFSTKSLFKGLTMARISRSVYKENLY